MKLCVLVLSLQNYNTCMITLSLSGWRMENSIESFLLRFQVKVRKFSSIFYRSVDFQYQKRANAKHSSFERHLSLFPFGKLSILCVREIPWHFHFRVVSVKLKILFFSVGGNVSSNFYILFYLTIEG